MICICLGKPSVEACKNLAADPQGSGHRFHLVEIRIDGAPLSPDEIRHIFSLPLKMIATCRPETSFYSREERKNALMTAISHGAAYVDIEIEADTPYKNEIIRHAQAHSCLVIISYHNFETTPPRVELEKIVNRCFEEGADIAKISCMTRSTGDCGRIMALYDSEPGINGKIVAIGMGKNGKITRVAAPILGAPFTYASISDGNETAPGQIDMSTLTSLVKHF